MKTLGVIRRQMRIGWCRAKSRNVVRVMAMEHHHRIVSLRMRVEPSRHQDVRADEDVAPPEMRQQRAADSDVPIELAIGLGRDLLDLLIEHQCDSFGMRRIQIY